jgi:DNA-binding CsgD family transcriptional regulator
MTRGLETDVFIGRADELAHLRAAVEDVAEGGGQVVLVEGEPGIGKTALLATGLAAAPRRGCRVLWTVADELARQLPLAALLACLDARQQADVVGEPVADDGIAGHALDPVPAMVERLLVVVERLCLKSPVVLVLDDLQWADEASLAAVRRLSAMVDQLPLLLVAAGRPAPRRPSVTRLWQAMARDAVVLVLRPLAQSEVMDLVDALTGGRAASSLRSLATQAGGNPLYVRELVDSVNRGRPSTSAPAPLLAAIAERFDFLSRDAGQVLRIAALLGPDFSVADLTTVTNWKRARLFEPLAEADAAGILVTSGPRLMFRHPLVRQALYESIPATLRSALHRQTAEGIARAGASVERVAEHLAAAPDAMDSWVLEWIATSAPDLARRAPQIAAQLVEGAVERMAVDDVRRGPLEDQLLGILSMLARYDKVEPLARSALARTTDPERAARIAWWLVYAMMRNGRGDEPREIIERVLGRTPANHPWTARLRVLHALVLEQHGRPAGREVAQQALAEAESSGDPYSVAHALHIMSIQVVRGDSAAGIDLIDRGLRVLTDDPESIDLRLLMSANRSWLLMTFDRWAEADTTLRECLMLAERTANPRLFWLQVTAAVRHFMTGRWDDAVVEVDSILARSDELHDVALPCRAGGLGALIAVHRDDRPAANRYLRPIAKTAITGAAALDNAAFMMLARACVAERGRRPEQAVELLMPTLHGEHSTGMILRYLIMPYLVRLALSIGDRATARSATEACAGDIGLERVPVKVAAANHCRGLLDADPALLVAAEGYYRAAGRALELGAALEDRAVLLAEAGHVDEARLVFVQSVEIFGGLGASWDVLRATSRVRPYGIGRGQRGPRKRPTSGWAALTPTELTVADLVGQGRSNVDIADELFLSRHTVQTHVSHILAKLAVKSRKEIAGEAERHRST